MNLDRYWESKVKVEIVGQAAPVEENRQGLPLFLSPIQAGSPTLAEDFVERELDLHRYLVRHESCTFLLTANGDSMLGAGIHTGDLLVVDRSMAARHNSVVIAAIDGELTCKRLVRREDGVFLAPENPAFPEIDITHLEYVHIWGVVTYVIHKL